VEKVIRSIISIIISGLVLYGIRSITQNDAPWITAIVCFGCAYPIIYSGRSQHLEQRYIKQEYIKLVGHSIGHEQIYRVLRRHGYRKIMPRSRHPKKASNEKIEQSKKKLPIWCRKQK